jgi:hypothetical protein
MSTKLSIIRLLNRATHLELGGDNVGVWVPIDVWRKIDEKVREIPYSVARPPARDEIEYTLTEPEVGLVALMAYVSENTPRAFGEPASIRLIGRLHPNICYAVVDYCDWRQRRAGLWDKKAERLSHPMGYSPWDDGTELGVLKCFHGEGALRHGIEMTIENGAILAEIARNNTFKKPRNW